MLDREVRIHETTRNHTNSSQLVLVCFRVVSWIALAVCPDKLTLNIQHEETLKQDSGVRKPEARR